MNPQSTIDNERRPAGFTAVPLVAGLVIAAFSSGCDQTAMADESRKASGGPVLVELYTSQGCSSCPPADSVLIELGNDSSLSSQIVPLSFHVDYWNYLGWKDPFSKKRWSTRQRSYSSAMRSNEVYTPQMIVSGQGHFVGSREREARSAIAATTKRPQQARLSVVPKRAGDKVRVTANVEVLREDLPSKLTLQMAVVERNLQTRVRRGENGGRTLKYDFVVRDLKKACDFDPGAGKKQTCAATFDVDDKWNKDNLRFTAFLQHASHMTVHGVALHTKAK